MKHIFLTTFVWLSLCASLCKAQGVAYYVLEDSADRIASSYIDLVYFDYEGSMSNQLKYHKGVPGGLATLRADMKLSDPVGVEGQLGMGWFGEKLDVVRPLRIEAGGNYKVKTKYREQDIKVHLRSYKVKADVTDKTTGTYLGRVDALKTEFIEVPARKKFEYFGRAG
ncbi:MAG: hypothetical protein JJ975_07920, partial [Bacteroidia bacterium]|nr:hypothetical protein [Bacteroidia bacterium]